MIYTGSNLTCQEKYLILEFLAASVQRCMTTSAWFGWASINDVDDLTRVPQGVSIYHEYPDGRIEYRFSKNEKVPINLDTEKEAIEAMHIYTAKGYTGDILYMNKEMLLVAKYLS